MYDMLAVLFEVDFLRKLRVWKTSYCSTTNQTKTCIPELIRYLQTLCLGRIQPQWLNVLMLLTSFILHSLACWGTQDGMSLSFKEKLKWCIYNNFTLMELSWNLLFNYIETNVNVVWLKSYCLCFKISRGLESDSTTGI